MQSPVARRSAHALFLLLGVLCLAPSAAWAGLGEEAGRQLDFARDELDQGDYERAIKSAESALRLDPTRYEAFVLKALAYEGLGEHRLAESLLVAYSELRGGLEEDSEAATALARLRERSSRRAGKAKFGRSSVPLPKTIVLESEAGEVDVAPLNHEPYRWRVEDALRKGRCAAAQSAAAELTRAAPNLPEAWRIYGDAERCSQRNRGAVLAYRRYSELGGDETPVLNLMEDLAGTLGTLSVAVAVDDASIVPFVELLIGDEQLGAERRGERYFFSDLPTGSVSELYVSGRGLEAAQVDVPPLTSGQQLELTVTPTYVGLGTVKLADHSLRLANTVLLSSSGLTPIGPNESRLVTAGTVIVAVNSSYGTVEVPIDLAPGSEVTFDPTPWLPAALTLIDVPAGSTLRLFIEGRDGATLERGLTLPPRRGIVDTKSGVRLAPPVRLESLLGGLGGLHLSHPRLGDVSMEIGLRAGSGDNASTVKWRDLHGVGALGDEYRQWLQRVKVEKQRTTAGVVVPLGVTIGSLIAGGVLWGLAAESGASGRDARQRAIDAQDACGLAGDNCPDADEWGRVRDEAFAKETSFVVGAAVASGVATVGASLTVTFGVSGRNRLAREGEWQGQ